MESETQNPNNHGQIPNPQVQEIPKKMRSTMESIIQNLLKTSQVKTEATSNIVAKLNEFSMKYMMETLEEAKLFAEYAKRNNITGEDVKLLFFIDFFKINTSF